MAFVYWIHLAKHTNIISEGYIGFTSKTVKVRLSQHLKDSNNKKYAHFPLYRALTKHGTDILVTTLVEGSSQYCLDIEHKLRPQKSIGWNIMIGGGKPTLGCKVSEETKSKIRKSLTGTSPSLEARLNMGAARKGKEHSKEAKDKIGLSRSKWKHPKASDVWQNAQEIFEYFKKSAKPCEVMRVFNLTRIVADKLYRHFRNGWNPNEDQEYLSWLEEKKGTT